MEKGVKALIFGSMPCENWNFLAPYSTWPDLVIAADGGTACAAAAGFAPDVYVGDGDSGGSAPSGAEAILLPVEKDVTDLEAAYQIACGRGAKEILFTGCSGGRVDQYLAALGLLETAAKDGIQAVLQDCENRVECLLPGTYTVPDRGYRYFSLCPLDAVAKGMTIQKAKYTLDGKDVCRGSSLTISNAFLSGEAQISWTEGNCLFIYSDPIQRRI